MFETIADSVMPLCDAWSVAVYPFDGEQVHITATRGGLPDSASYLKGQYPMRPTRDVASITARAILERTIVHVPDSELDDRPNFRETARARGFRAAVGVPMLRGGEPIGAIGASRAEPGAFSPAQIALLQTFADQAVIAIENVRLFQELKESLEQQTATSEILGVIASSPTDIQPVLDTIAENAARVCGSYDALIRLADGNKLRLAAHYGPLVPGFDREQLLTRDSVGGRGQVRGWAGEEPGQVRRRTLQMLRQVQPEHDQGEDREHEL